MFYSIMFLLSAATAYGPVQAHNDSLYIYNVYAESAGVFKTIDKSTEWNTLSDSVQQVTAAAFARLNKYNQVTYAAIDELNREGLGVAYVYPKPLEVVMEEVEAKANAEAKETATPNVLAKEKEVAFKVLDEQTHFMTGPNGKGKIPYIIMNYYTKGRVLIRSERLNPVTHLPIQTGQMSLTASSN